METVIDLCENDVDCNSDTSNTEETDLNLESRLELISEDPRQNLDMLHLENEEFFEILFENLPVVYWTLPPLHQANYYATKLSESQRDKILKLKLPWKRGWYTEEEDQIILKNWTRLCKKYKIPNRPDIIRRFRNTNKSEKHRVAREFVILWLSRNLPERIPTQIFQRFACTLGKVRSGKFTDYELAILEGFIYEKKYAHTQRFLGPLLGRADNSITKTVRTLREKNKPNYIDMRFKWNLEMSRKLVDCIMLTCECNLSDLRDYKISFSIWKKISHIMHISPLKLKLHWDYKLYSMIFSREPIYLRKVIFKLLLIFKERDYKYWQQISWSEISTKFDSLTGLFLNRIFYGLCAKLCKEFLKDLRRVVKFLLEKLYITKELTYHHKNKKLSRIGIDDHGDFYFKDK